MKRAIIIVGWVIAFPVVTWLFAGFIVLILMLAGLRAWPRSIQMPISMIWSVLFFCSPVIALFLGLTGRLPGTKKSMS